MEGEDRLNWSFDPHTFLAMFQSRSSNAYFWVLWYGVSNQAALGEITEKERGGREQADICSYTSMLRSCSAAVNWYIKWLELYNSVFQYKHNITKQSESPISINVFPLQTYDAPNSLLLIWQNSAIKPLAPTTLCN